MPILSTPPDMLAGEAAVPRGRHTVILRTLAALTSAVSLFVLWFGEGARVSHDLQLVAEEAARPGEQIALRAFLFSNVDAPEGPVLVRRAVMVRLLDAAGTELATTDLAQAASDSMEGWLRVPETARGALTLEATARHEEVELACRRVLRVSPDVRERGAEGRSAGPLQHFALGSVQALEGHIPPAPFLPRVLGGACVAEERCTMLVWVGEPPAAVSLRENARVSSPREPAPKGETSGIVAIELVVHGPEAETVLEAYRGGARVAERSLRLPIALGEVALSVSAPLVDAGAAPVLALGLPPGRTRAIVDVFEHGRWRFTRTLPERERTEPVALDPTSLAPGLARVQARTDRFSSDGAGTRALYLRAPGEGDERALAAMAGFMAVRGDDEVTRLFQKELPGFALADPQRAAAFLLQPLEESRMELPAAASSRPSELARMARARTRARFGVSFLLLVAALIVGASLMKRGLSASDEARSILARGADAAHDRVPELHGERARVILLVLSVILAFLGAALLIAAKPLWF